MCDGGVRRLLRLVPVWAPLRGVSPVLECGGGRVGRARLPFIPRVDDDDDCSFETPHII